MKKLIAVLIFVGIAALSTGCKKEEAPPANAADQSAMDKEMQQMSDDAAGATTGETLDSK